MQLGVKGHVLGHDQDFVKHTSQKVLAMAELTPEGTDASEEAVHFRHVVEEELIATIEKGGRFLVNLTIDGEEAKQLARVGASDLSAIDIGVESVSVVIGTETSSELRSSFPVISVELHQLETESVFVDADTQLRW